jgi:hypothetical protein
MNDLNTLLERAAGPTTAPVDSHADLARGRRALSRTRRRRGAIGLAGVAAAGVAGVGITRLETDHGPSGGTEAADHSAGPSQHPTALPSHATDDRTVAPIVLLAQPTDVGAFSFDQVPEGWEAQEAPPGDDPGVSAALGKNLVTFATADFPDKYPENFLGKLVIMFNKTGTFGEQRQVHGRTFWINTHGGGPYTQLYVHTRAGEPPGVLDVQYPDNTGWTQDDMIAFLDGIHLGPDATPNSLGG